MDTTFKSIPAYITTDPTTSKKVVKLPKNWSNEWTYDETPNAVAIKTGKDSDLFVVDCDSELSAKIIAAFDVKPSVISPNGYHFYFHHQEELKTGSNKNLSIDTRGNGGLIFQGAYTTHDGVEKTYQVLSDERQPMPSKLLTFLKDNGFGKVTDTPATPATTTVPEDHTQKQLELIDTLVQKSNDAIKGNRSEVDYGVICKLIELGLSKDNIQERLRLVGKFRECGDRYFESTYQRATEKTKYIPNLKSEDVVITEVLSDKSNSQILEEHYVHDVVWNRQRRKFYRFGSLDTWEEFPIEELEHEAAKLLDDSIRAEIQTEYSKGKFQDNRLKTLYSHHRYSNSTRGIQQAVIQFRNAVSISDSLFDSKPHLVVLENGTYDLKERKFRESRKSDYITKRFNFYYDPEAKCESWDKFISETLSDPELRNYMKKFLGYSLSGYTDIQKAFFWYGIGANGKSVLREFITSMWGAYSYIANTSLFTLGGPSGGATPEKANLKSKRIALSEELQDNQRMNEAEVKALTGGDTISARHLYQDLIEFKPSHKLVMIGNHKPIIHGTDHSIWRRMALIEFSNVVPEDKQIDQSVLLERFYDERAGILNWLIEGWNDYKTEGLKEPSIIKEKTKEYKDSMDMVQEFIYDCCELDMRLDVEEKDLYSVPATDLYKAYRSWCDENGETFKLTSTKFGRNLADKRLTKKRTMHGNQYLGIRLSGPQAY